MCPCRSRVPARRKLAADRAGKLAEAADIIAEHPIALQLRNLQVLGEIASEHNSTIVFPAQLMAGAQAVTRFVAGEATTDGEHRPARAARSGHGSPRSAA